MYHSFDVQSAHAHVQERMAVLQESQHEMRPRKNRRKQSLWKRVMSLWL